MGRRVTKIHFVVSDEPGQTNSGVEKRIVTYACRMTRPCRFQDTEDKARVTCPKCSQAIWKRELKGLGDRVRIEPEENEAFAKRVRTLLRIVVDGDLVGWTAIDRGYNAYWYLVPVSAMMTFTGKMVVEPNWEAVQYKVGVPTGHSREEIAVKAVERYDADELIGEAKARAKAEQAYTEFRAEQALRRAASPKETLS